MLRTAACLALSSLLLGAPVIVRAEDAIWKAGVASTKITPEQSLWMAGYASRTKPSEGVAQDLFAKALAISDANDRKVVFLTLDLIGVPRTMRETLAAKLHQKHGLPAESLLMNASHTHCGPELRGSRITVNPGDDAKALNAAYAVELEQKLFETVERALANLTPSKLGYSHARCGFAMNRRLPSPKGYQNSPYPEGPVDHNVPIIRVESPDGQLRAVLFGYACHNTTLGFYEFCGDYAGYAQEYLQEAHPDVTALFMLGCGGDQNPYPRGKLELAQQHGRSLANAVETALLPTPTPLTGTLATALETVVLEFAPPASREELDVQAKSANKYEASHAKRLIEQLETRGKIDVEYPYLIHGVRLGNELTLVALSGEVVVDYSLRLQREWSKPGSALWVAGYSNDVFGYVPSRRVLNEGGYEAGGAMLYTGFPGPFAPDVEERIVGGVHRAWERLAQP
ncbi:neutral/alkaline non-lysosomal ceramidase N-terminal domain-containing protein [Planctellipticum variicoloris]|uniref:neutral/alkaline non-lysosomal ceramidase N-terminal domain-containing protein n=1 Tax=Planctellipticum variicoloris TaxID=3064265 RepID=UPI0030134065|nr:neutral/alkaline non-lysosomal ceramidase N-terminal domain-containing protein [Planctomycetaceae bacterium SH412]